MRRTKLIATIGPASMSREKIFEMVRKGVDAYRLNFSHGTSEEKKVIIRYIREAASKYGKRIPIMADLQGPVIRIWTEHPVNIERGKKYRIDLKKGVISIPNKSFFKNVSVGDVLLVDDGKLLFKTIEVHDDHIYVTASVDGTLETNKKVLIKGKEIIGEPLTDKDLADLKFSLDMGVEYIALSMVRTGDDIGILREHVEKLGGDPWLIAKVENPSGVENIIDIVEMADGVMVARGDLGQYYPLEKIPTLQKSITYEGNKRGKITIVATQILESMRTSETPTRAEVTDVFKSVEERVDAILLTGETAIGRYPIEVVEWASKILEEADNQLHREIMYYNDDFKETLFDKFARGVIYVAHLLNGVIIGYTKKGNTARRLARYRPKRELYIVTHDEGIGNKISLLYGAKPILVKQEKDYHEIFEGTVDKLMREGVIKKGDIVIFTVGVRPDSTDMLRIEIV